MASPHQVTDRQREVQHRHDREDPNGLVETATMVLGSGVSKTLGKRFPMG